MILFFFYFKNAYFIQRSIVLFKTTVFTLNTYLPHKIALILTRITLHLTITTHLPKSIK